MGSLPQTTYYAVITYLNSFGETIASGEATLTIGSGNLLVVKSPSAATGAVNWNAYVAAELQVPSGTALNCCCNTGGFLLGGTTYYYKVTALDINSPIDGSIGETTGTESSCAVPAGTNTNKIQVTWNAVTGAVGYRIYRGTSSGGEMLIGQVPGNSTIFMDTVSTFMGGPPPTSNSTGKGREVLQNTSPIAIGTNWTENTAGLSGGPGCLITKIIGFTDSAHVTLAYSWPFTGSSTGLTCTCGIDDTNALQNWLNAEPTAGPAGRRDSALSRPAST